MDLSYSSTDYTFQMKYLLKMFPLLGKRILNAFLKYLVLLVFPKMVLCCSL